MLLEVAEKLADKIPVIPWRSENAGFMAGGNGGDLLAVIFNGVLMGVLAILLLAVVVRENKI